MIWSSIDGKYISINIWQNYNPEVYNAKTYEWLCLHKIFLFIDAGVFNNRISVFTLSAMRWCFMPYAVLSHILKSAILWHYCSTI